MIQIHHVWLDSDIDCYEFYTLELQRELDEWDNHNILEIDSLFHFFECVNVQADGVEDIYKHLVNLCLGWELPFFTEERDPDF